MKSIHCVRQDGINLFDSSMRSLRRASHPPMHLLASTSPQSWNTLSASIALICTTSRQILAGASINEASKKTNIRSLSEDETMREDPGPVTFENRG